MPLKPMKASAMMPTLTRAIGTPLNALERLGHVAQGEVLADAREDDHRQAVAQGG